MATSNVEFGSSSITAAGVLAPTKGLLRFTTAGSVDDGKSTLIGRLLYDSQAVYEDQLASVRKSRINRSTGPLDFSLLTDGLRAEREQGITIDVAYRYFSTPRRKFIIADTPGHEQYTRNMATGASTADAAIVLIDATRGVQPQSRRHTYIASLFGIQHVIAAVNKMDLVSYSEDVFKLISEQVEELGALLGITNLYIVPISALDGDNVVRRSPRISWFQGPSLLEYLEQLEIESVDVANAPLRLPVQYVIRPDANFRGFAGQIESGVLRGGDTVTALPSGVKTKIASIVTFDGELNEARAGDAVTVTLEDQVDLSRGDLLVSEKQTPTITPNFAAKLVWMHPDPLDSGKFYQLKHTTRTMKARIREISHRVDVNTLRHVPAATLQLNDIATVEINASLPLFFDRYQEIRALGSFILIDPITNATVAAGMIEDPIERPALPLSRPGPVTADERRIRNGHGPAAVLIEARPRAAEVLERALFEEGWNVQLVSADLGAQQAPLVARILHGLATIAVFSTANSEPELLRAIRLSFTEQVLFTALDDGRSDSELALSLLEQLRAWRRRDLAEAQS